MVYKQIDALLVLCMALSREELEHLQKIDIPLVVVGGHVEGCAYIGIDDYEAASTAVRHLIGLGHQDIALLHGDDETDLNFDVPRVRIKAFQDVMAQSGLDVRPEWDEWGDFTVRSGQDAFQRLWDRPGPKPTAIFCASDEMAMGVLFEARRAGVRIPEELSVVGIDDHEFSAAVGLTTVGQRPDEQAELGTKMLLDELDGIAGAVRSTVAPHRLIVRDTTAAPQLAAPLAPASGQGSRRTVQAAKIAPGFGAGGAGSGSAGQLPDRNPAGGKPTVGGGRSGHVTLGEALDAQPHVQRGIVRVDLVRHRAVIKLHDRLGVEEFQPLGELGQVLQHVQVRGGEGQMGDGVPDPLQRRADRRPDAHRDNPAAGLHHVRGIRFLEQAEPAERDAPGRRPGVDPADPLARLHLVDAFLVPVPLFLRDQQLGQRAVDPLHQGVGGQPGAEHQLARAVQQRGRQDLFVGAAVGPAVDAAVVERRLDGRCGRRRNR